MKYIREAEKSSKLLPKSKTWVIEF